MIPGSLFSSAHRSRRRRTPQQLFDTQLDAFARALTPQDYARVRAQRTRTPGLSRNRIWQKIQDEFAQ